MSGRQSRGRQWKFSNMNEHITNACSAMFIHNINSGNFKLDFKKAPLASLLKICDELQDWERPKLDEPNGRPSKDYSLKFEDNQLIFYVKKERKDCLNNKISNILNCPVIIKELGKPLNTVQR